MTTLDSCSWDRPGFSRFTGDPVVAVARYNLPPDVVKDLQAKMSARRYDDLATITRDDISSPTVQYSDLRSMHFGSKGKVCNSVTRSKWAVTDKQMALIYCSGDYCVALPTVCGNLSLITKRTDYEEDRQYGGGGTLRWGEAAPVEGGHATPWGQSAPGSDWLRREESRDPGGAANSFSGVSGHGSFGGYGSTHLGGGGGGGGGSLTFSQIVNNVTQVTNVDLDICCYDVPPVPIATSVPEVPAYIMLLMALAIFSYPYAISRRKD